jgi:mono/diheme cytochrome c family protein
MAKTTSSRTTTAAARPRAADACVIEMSATHRCTYPSSPTITIGALEMARPTFPITARRLASFLLRSSGLAAALLYASAAGAYEPHVNYMLHCMGCHTPDGRGEPGRVPSVRDTLVPLASKPAGRRFLIRVPGSAQSKLSDADLANLSAVPAPRPVAKFTAAEVAAYRHTPLVAVKQERRRLIAGAP